MRRRAEVLWRAAPGYLLLTSVDGPLVTITGGGADVWALLETEVSRAEIVEVLSTYYSRDPAEIERDLSPLFASLVDGEFVTDDE